MRFAALFTHIQAGFCWRVTPAPPWPITMMDSG